MRYSCTPSRHIQAKAARKQKCKMPAMMEHTSWQRGGQAETLGARVGLSFPESQNDISPSWTYFKICKLKRRFSSNQYFWLKSATTWSVKEGSWLFFFIISQHIILILAAHNSLSRSLAQSRAERSRREAGQKKSTDQKANTVHFWS